MQHVKEGEAGEIYIGGLGVAIGYYNNDAMTTASFIPDPFDSTLRVYRTGDYGKVRNDQNVEYPVPYPFVLLCFFIFYFFILRVMFEFLEGLYPEETVRLKYRDTAWRLERCIMPLVHILVSLFFIVVDSALYLFVHYVFH